MTMMLDFGILSIVLKQELNYRDPTKLTVGLGQFDNNDHKYGLVQFEKRIPWLDPFPQI
jgi:hypothetical protein